MDSGEQPANENDPGLAAPGHLGQTGNPNDDPGDKSALENETSFGMRVASGLAEVDPLLISDFLTNLELMDCTRKELFERAVRPTISSAWMVGKGSKAKGPPLQLKEEIQATAASQLSRLGQQFIESEVPTWDPSMRADKLEAYVQQRNIKMQTKLAAAAAETMPLGQHTNGQHSGASLITSSLGMTTLLTGAEIVLRPESFLEGIDGQQTLSAWRDVAAWVSHTRHQMQVQVRRGPWATRGKEWLMAAYGLAYLLPTTEPRARSVHLFTGLNAFGSPLDQLERRYTTSIGQVFYKADVLGVGEDEVVAEWVLEAIGAFRERIGFAEDTSDVQLKTEPIRAKDDAEAVRVTFVWVVRRAVVGFVAGAARLVSMPSVDPAQVVDQAAFYPELLVLAARMVISFANRVEAIASPNGGEEGTCYRTDLDTREGFAELFRYWKGKWRGTPCLWKALFCAAARVDVDPGDPDSQAVLRDSSRVGLPAGVPSCTMGCNPFRQCPARTKFICNALSPITHYMVENDAIVRYAEDSFPSFPCDVRGLEKVMRRLSVMLTLASDQEVAAGGLGAYGTMFGVGWAGHADWDTEVGSEAIRRLEALGQQQWNSTWGAVTGLEVVYSDFSVDFSSVGSARHGCEELVMVQRLPCWSAAMYFSHPYLPPREAPRLGPPVWVKARHGAGDADIGQWFDISHTAEDGRGIFYTSSGSGEDSNMTPYPLGYLTDGSFDRLQMCAQLQEFDASFALVRSHNRSVGTAPFVFMANGDGSVTKIIVRARSPPQPGGLACLGHNEVPMWAADAPATSRVVVGPSFNERFSRIATFRR